MNKPPKVRFRPIDPLQDYYCDIQGDQYSVARLVDETRHLKPFSLPIAAVTLSDAIWQDKTIFDLAFHVKKVMEADLSKPIILDWHGNVADGRHRIIKALVEGKRTIKAVRMTWKIEPDKVASDG